MFDETSTALGTGGEAEINAVGDQRAELRKLIKAAFESARSSGKENWSMMTVAVLKNRLLNLTNRQFSELKYGAQSISDLVQQVPDLIELDTSSQPPIVRLVEKTRHPVGSADVLPRKIRQDLWDAIMDYRLGEPYVWNGARAVPQSSYSGEGEDLPALPTLTEREEGEWRRRFVEGLSGVLDPESQARLQNWVDGHLGTRALPDPLRTKWNDELKARVVSCLRNWFEENNVPLPADFAAGMPKVTRKVASPVEELRSLVMRCVQRMTLEELSELRLPPQALLRGQR